MERYKTVYEGGTGEIIEKKSRFIANVIPISSEEEALIFIERMRKQYWDATHNCFAYVLGLHNELARCSDDGEPPRTAGRPMLDVLLGEGIRNTAVVVTRYFGGTLLGTGGLVRAYQGAAKEGLKNSLVIEKIYGRPLTIRTDYNGIGKIQYLIAQNGLSTLSVEYTDLVVIQVLLTPQEEAGFTKQVLEATNGKAGMNFGDPVYFADINGQTTLFPE